MKDLWPEEIQSVRARPPVVILEEQGALLGEKTKNLIRGRVREVESIHRRDFNFIFMLEAPSIRYSFSMLQIRYGIKLYPVQVKPAEEIADELGWGKDDEWQGVQNEDDFSGLLSRVFRTQCVRVLIAAILAQVEHRIPEG